MKTCPVRLFLVAMLCLVGGVARAEKWALLIGINQYEDRNYIASLGSADNDARKLKMLLREKLSFPDANIVQLVSDGDTKPTRANIIEELGKLKERANPGDTVFVFYSGHGIDIQGKPYLLPYDFRGRSMFTGVQTALALDQFKELLGEVRAKALVMVWDMCRNDPFAKGKSGTAGRPKMADTKSWNLTPATAARGSDAPIVANLFACSPGECSFEWIDKNRGYFAYFLEQGLRGEAVDARGNVTLGSLAKYVRSQVIATTTLNEGTAQSPIPELIGPDAQDFVLARGTAPAPVVTPEPTKPVVETAPPPAPGLTAKIALEKIREAHRADALATAVPLQFTGSASGSTIGWRITRSGISATLAPATGEFRTSYSLKQERPRISANIVAGFGGGKAWKTQNGKSVTISNERFTENPIGPLLAVLSPQATILPLADNNNGYTDIVKYEGGSFWVSVPGAGVFKVLFNLNTFQIERVILKTDSDYPYFSYGNYRDVGGLPIPQLVRENRIHRYKDKSFSIDLTVTTTYSKIEPATGVSSTFFLQR